MTELTNILLNAGGAVALAYVVLMWKREDDREARGRLIELIERVEKSQSVTADALKNLTHALTLIHDRIIRLETIKEIAEKER